MSETSRYAVFIWSAYGVTGLVSAVLVVAAFLGHRAQVRALGALEARLGNGARDKNRDG